jgi:mRNA interferase RelE/StbE
MYKILFDVDFRKNIKKLDVTRQKAILKKIDFLRDNPDHPSLRTEKLYKGTTNETRASSINMGIRLIWQLIGDEIKVIDVGGHDIYRKYKFKKKRQ